MKPRGGGGGGEGYQIKNVEKYIYYSLVSRDSNYLATFKQWLEEFKKYSPQKLKTKSNRTVDNNAKKVYSKL